jgi:hypothetical protein
MSTLTQLQSAALALPLEEQSELLQFLARRVRAGTLSSGRGRKLKAAARQPLEGLPPDLSTETRTKVRDLMARRYAANR